MAAKFIIRLLVGLGVTVLSINCTDADLFIDLAPESAVMRMGLKVQVCSPDPIVENVPYKILFVIDTSLSNRWNDPDEHRVDAFLNAVQDHVSKDSVFFGIVTFNDYAHRPTLVFTDNKDILTTAASALTGESAGGGTNYEDAIHEMYQFIVDDLDTMNNPLEALRTHYLVYWLSDGFPTFGTTDRATLVANVDAVKQYFKPKVGEFRLNTLYLESSGEWESEEEILGARLLLKEMAEAAEGAFTNVSNGESFEFDIDPTPQVRSFRFSKAMAYNANAQFGRRHPLPDSDGDGLIDDVEPGLGLDPSLEDTDGDFYRDAVEFRSGWLSPTRPDTGCMTDDLDSDGDGLWDCEEQVLGTDPYDPDTDGDYLLDSMEFLLDGSPLSEELTTDSDMDGLPDTAEVIAHLEPRQETTEMDQQLWSYQYELKSDTTEPGSGKHCYTIDVDNVSVYQTMETPQHPTGWQTIDFVVAFETEDAMRMVKFYRAKARAGFLFPGEVYPPTALLELKPEDFKPLSATCKSDGPGCHLPPQINCGNGLVDDGEECDEANLKGNTCASLGYSGGRLACDLTCRLDVSDCEGGESGHGGGDGGECGNGVLDDGEECDGEQIAGLTCESMGLSGYGLACDEKCKLDLSACTSRREDCSNQDAEEGICDPVGRGGVRGGFSCQSSAPGAVGPNLVWFLIAVLVFFRKNNTRKLFS